MKKHHTKNRKRVHELKAVKDFKEARVSTLDSNPVKLQSALILHKQGDLADAEVIYREILQSQPHNTNALTLLGTIAGQRGDFAYALEIFELVLKIDPNHFASLNDRGVVLLDLQRYEEALVGFDKCIALKPDFAEGYNHRGNALQKLNRYDDAILSYEKAIVLRPNYAEAYAKHGLALYTLKRYNEAIVSYEKAIALCPGYAEAHSNHGLTLHKLTCYTEAIVSYEKAIALRPDYMEAYSHYGLALHQLMKYDEALLLYEKAISINPNYAEAYHNLGLVLHELKRYEQAVLSYDKALAINQNYAEAYLSRGNSSLELKRYEEAVVSYDNAIALNPDGAFWFGERLYTKMRMCDWSNFEDYSHQLASKIKLYKKAVTPFIVLAIVDSLSLQQKAALIYVKDKCSTIIPLQVIPKRNRHDKIRIGYYSADFQHHATAYLMADLFERHDKSRFEFYAFSFGPDRPEDVMRKRVVAAFDKFIDVRTKSDKEVVLLSRELAIDIAIDLKGFTQDSRTGIFGLRAAPIQVNYLGYPGTMGAEYIDYIIADTTLIPEQSQQFYTEKIIYLPHSYQVNDTKRLIAEKELSREELGLPATGFVFCCFNNNYKITPNTFDCWMRILMQVEGSVLWLYEDNPKAGSNLQREAKERGINPERLIFAKRMHLADHLARHRVADLFLDTLPCNAHTTASDALWAGLPVITCMGEAFASRVAASLLNAIDLPELITSTQDAYEALAIELANNPDKLHNIKQKLERNRLTTPLFDTELFTRHIEEAYITIYERYQADLPPDHLYIKKQEVNKFDDSHSALSSVEIQANSTEGDTLSTKSTESMQHIYKSCPLCDGKSVALGSCDCTRHNLWHEPLPRTLEWVRCTTCSHVYTRYYWSQKGLDEVFKNAHPNQLAGDIANFDAKRLTWASVAGKVLSLLGGYRSVMNSSLSPSWVDVGCGDGALVMTASDVGFTALGLDSRSEPVSRIQKCGFKALQGDFMAVTFQEKLDVLSMMDVLEHMPFPMTAIKKAADVIKPGGILVISMPDLNCSSWKMMDAAKANPYWMEIEHHHNFSRQRLTILLQDNGFEVADFAIPYRYKAQMEIYAIRVSS